MKITQRSSRTIEIASHGGTLLLSYHIFWNGHEREPESIVLDGDEARAFFLFATIIDRISEDPLGLTIERSWSIMTPGAFRLSFEADFPVSDDRQSCLFPGSALLSDLPSEPCAMPGDRMSLPSALALFTGACGILLFSGLPGDESDSASIGARRSRGEDGDTLVVEVRIPPMESALAGPAAAGQRREHARNAAQSEITSAGSLEKKRMLYVVFAEREQIVLRGIRAACARLGIGSGDREGVIDLEEWKAALAACLRTHLYQSGGVMGLRETPSSPCLSASAGISLALLLIRLFPSDVELTETALRLADFCLRGQHPMGLFFETYSIEEGEWKGAKGCLSPAARRARKSDEAPRVPIAESSAIADGLLRLSEALASRGMPAEKYRLAAVRFVEFFLDEKEKIFKPGALHVPGDRLPAESGFSGLEILFPLHRLFEATRRDKYKRALDALAADFLSIPLGPDRPPRWREERDADSRAALLCGRMAVEIDRLGREDVDAALYLSVLAPWVHLNRPAGNRSVDTLGGIADSFNRQRLLFAGAEAAYVLLSLGEICRHPDQRETSLELARLVMGFSRGAPLGAAFLQHIRWVSCGKPSLWQEGVVGPVDSRRLIREADFALRLLEEFPRFGKAGGAQRRLAGRRETKPRGKRAPKASSRSGSAGRSRKPSGRS